MNETSREGPLTATLGERLKDDPHVQEVAAEVRQSARSARAAGGRPFPWAALALAAVAWALATGIGRGLRSRARSVGGGGARARAAVR